MARASFLRFVYFTKSQQTYASPEIEAYQRWRTIMRKARRFEVLRHTGGARSYYGDMVAPTPHEVDVSPRGDTVWVNSAIDGSCIGRFSKRFGMDVHRSGSEQLAGMGECIHCTHEPAGPAEWEQFTVLMQQHYGVQLDPRTITYH